MRGFAPVPSIAPASALRRVYAEDDLGDMWSYASRHPHRRLAPGGPRGAKRLMAHSVERKLTTILCADVHGYSRLMEQDEAATLATLKLYREAMDGLIARHRG